MAAATRFGIGGWRYPAWRRTFYPPGVRIAGELAHASRALGSIEINATFYRTQTAAVFAAWREATPEGFVFAVKAARAATMTGDPARAAAAIDRFLDSGLVALGPRLGPILWQFPPTRRFDAPAIAAFADALPPSRDGTALRHAVEFTHPTGDDPALDAILRARGIARAWVAPGPALPGFHDTADFVYARLKGSADAHPLGFPADDIRTIADRIRDAAGGRDAFVYVIGGAKGRNPAAAMALAAA